jgi:hypothetical protein
MYQQYSIVGSKHNIISPPLDSKIKGGATSPIHHISGKNMLKSPPLDLWLLASC